jgi:serine/threonine-protein kinase
VLLAAIAGVAVLGVVGAGLWGRSRQAPVADKSVAILPFSTLGGDSTQAYFAEGMADELTTSLTRIPGLRVAVVNAAAGTRASALSPQEAGRLLHVATLLTGAVQRSGDQIRVRAQLVNTVDGTALWSDHFDEKGSDVFAAQDHLAQRISVALHDQLATGNVVVANDHGTKDPVAYDLYLQARHLFARRGSGNLKQAIRLYGEAAARDSSFARAYSGAAMAYVVLPQYEAESTTVRIDRGLQLGQRALRADSTDIDALLAIGYGHTMRTEWREAEPYLKRALELSPQNLTAHHWYGDFLLASGRAAEGVRELRIARDIDPLSAIVQSEYAFGLMNIRQYEGAIVEGQKGVALDSTLGLAYLNYAAAFLHVNKPDSAITQLRKTIALDSAAWGARGYIIAALVAKGLTDSARHETDRVLRGVRPPDGSLDAIIALTALGDRGRAIDYLDAAVKSGAGGLLAGSGVFIDPLLDPLRVDPRYKAILAKMGIRP